METIGERVRRLRESQGIERKDLARVAGMSYSGLSDLESGKAKTTTKLHRLATALGVDVDWLETGKGEREPRKAAPESASQAVRLDPDTVRDVMQVLQKIYRGEYDRDYSIMDEPEIFVGLYERTIARCSAESNLFWLGSRTQGRTKQGATDERSADVHDRGNRKRNAGPAKR